MNEEPMTKAAIVARYPRSPEILLSLLHDLQRASPENFLAPDDLALAAAHVGLTLAEVRDAVTFYSMFSLRPRGRHIVRLCESPNCHLAGAWSALDELRSALGVGVGETTADGAFTLELTSCLGACAVAPVMMVDDEVVGNLNPERVRDALARYREGGQGVRTEVEARVQPPRALESIPEAVFSTFSAVRPGFCRLRNVAGAWASQERR